MLRADRKEHYKTSVASVLHNVAQKIPKRSLVIIFSDMFENQSEWDKIFSGLQHLKHNQHEVLLFHVTDHNTELEFNFEERPYEFIDMEQGERLKLSPSQVKGTYRDFMKKYYHDLKIKCGQAKIDFIETDINQGFESLLKTYLLKRSKLK